MPFWHWAIQPDGSVTRVIEATRLLDIFEHNQKIGLKVDMVKHARFKKEVIDKLTDNSNPVIMKIAK